MADATNKASVFTNCRHSNALTSFRLKLFLHDNA